jgi:F0F1-type ATP synthase membrane subunit b/b'
MIPNLSVLWVIAFVLLLATIVERLLLRPLIRTMTERETAVRSARELAEAAAARATEAAARYEAETREARGEIYKQMDERRRAALEHRAALMADARRQVEADLANARAQLDADAAAARARLAQDAEALGAAVAERILGRQAS